MYNDDAARNPGRHDWLAALLLRQPDRFMPRLAVGLARWRGLSRGLRRRLQGKMAAGAVGAALVLAIGGGAFIAPSAHAATITVNEVTCTLVDAIRSANTNAIVGGCAAGASGVDTIDLQADVTLTAAAGAYYGANSGLPLITEDLIIEGNDHFIDRNASRYYSSGQFRIVTISSGTDVTLNDVTISDGYIDIFLNGTGIYVNNASLTLNRSTVTGNGSFLANGTIYQKGGKLTVTDSDISNNDTRNGGGIFQRGGELHINGSTFSGNADPSSGGNGGGVHFEELVGYGPNKAYIENSTFTGNYAYAGGAIFLNGGEMEITQSVISGNKVYYGRGGGIYQNRGALTIDGTTLDGNLATYYYGGAINLVAGSLDLRNSVISNNESTRYGGGLHVDKWGYVNIVNTTFSGNEADRGGAIAFSGVDDINLPDNTILHSTITGNTANIAGGGLFLEAAGFYRPALDLNGSIVSGNTAGSGDEIHDEHFGVSSSNNVLSDAAKATAAAFLGFTPDASDFDASNDAGNVAIGAILNTTLADNGGPTLTHLLVDLSPALDAAPSADCAIAPVSGFDQRGEPRNVDVPGVGSDTDNLCDIGAVEGTRPLTATVFMSARTAGATTDGVAFGPHDILKWDGTEWSKWFDGSAAGLMPNGRAKHNVNALWIPNPSGNEAILSFGQNSRNVPGITGKVDGMDLVRWDGSAFSLWFDGSDVGLTNKTQEKIDALHVLPGSASPIGGSCQAYLLISTQGPGRVGNQGEPQIRFGGEDVLGFCATNLGESTAGFWHMVLDGSAEGMPRNATDSISLSDDGNTLWLTTQRTFNVDSASGGHSMVYAWDFTTQTFSGPLFIAADNGLNATVNGLQVEGMLP